MLRPCTGMLLSILRLLHTEACPSSFCFHRYQSSSPRQTSKKSPRYARYHFFFCRSVVMYPTRVFHILDNEAPYVHHQHESQTKDWYTLGRVMNRILCNEGCSAHPLWYMVRGKNSCILGNAPLPWE